MTTAAVDEVYETRTGADSTSFDPRRHRGRQQPGASPGQRLHERDATLAEIRHALSGTFDRPRVPIVIEGLTGSGRTALLNATLEIGNGLGLRVVRARCDASESSAPFGVVRQVFSSVLHHTATPDEPMHDGTDLARRVLRDGHTSTDDPFEVYQSLILLLEATGAGPVLVAVDDVHWADSMSAGWLLYLARRLNTLSAHLVVTTRSRRAGVACPSDALVLDPATRRFVMHPLGIEATTVMLIEHLGAGIEPVAAAAHRVTGGNPLLIARLLGALDDLGTPTAQVTEQQIDALASSVVAHTVLSLVSTLPAGSLDLLEAAAIVGTVDLSVAAAVAEVEADEAGRLADALADIGVLGWGRPIEFVHPFERNSVYAEIQSSHRAEVHERAARVLASLGAEATDVARHLLETEPHRDDWARSVLVEAARHHVTSGDIELAARLLQRADREVTGDPVLRAEVAWRRAQVDGRLGRESAIAHLDRAAHLGLDQISLAATALDLLDQLKDHSLSFELLEIAQRTYDQLVIDQPDMARRLRLAETVLLPARVREQRGLQPDDPDDPTFAATSTGRLIAAQRALRDAAHLNCTYDQLIDAMQRSLTPEVLHGGGFVQATIVAASLSALVRIGAYAIADPLIGSAMIAARSDGRRFEADAYTVILAESLALQGRILAAEQLLADVDPADGDVFTVRATMQRGWFAALRERSGHQPVVIRVIPTTTAPGLAELGASAAMFVTESIGRVQLLDGDYAGALANFDKLASAAEQFDVRNPSFSPWRAGRSAALAGLGRIKEGAALADENLDLARAFGSPITIAEALACVARFQQPEAQVGLLNEAIGLITHSAAELLRCNLLIDLGFARHHAGDAHAARTAFRDSADQATRLGVTRLAGVAGRGLLACGARPRRLQMSGLDSLTPAELRVVTLAAAGHTNSAIAESLFINVKTVESHLTRVYKKLGVSDRAELQSAMEQTGGALEVPKAG